MTEKIEEFKQELKEAVQAIQEVAKETGVPFSEASVGSIAQTYLNNKGKDLRTEKISQKNGNGNGNGKLPGQAKGVAAQNEDKPATDGQIKMLYSLAKQCGKEPKTYLPDLFKKPLKSVTRKEASDAIGALRDLKDGKSVPAVSQGNGSPSATPAKESQTQSGNGTGGEALSCFSKGVSPENAGKPATEKQTVLLIQLAEKVAPDDPEHYISFSFGKSTAEMTMQEASEAISALKNGGDGQGKHAGASQQAQRSSPPQGGQPAASRTKAVSPKNADKPATDKQVNLLYSMAENLDPEDPDWAIQHHCGKLPREMTMQEASEAINLLKQAEQGVHA